MMKDVERQVKAIYETETAQKYFATDEGLRAGMDEGLTTTFSKLFAQLEKKYDRVFESAAKLLSEKMVNQVANESAVQLAKAAEKISGGLALKTRIFNSDLRETFKASINENTNLIVTIPKQYIDKVSRATYRSISSGSGLQDLQGYFEKWYGEDTRKAKNVALDQTRKAYNDINADRMRAVNLTKFEWIHSGGGHTPRRLHIDPYPAGLNGGIFDVNKPPIVDENTGERGLPGHAINCLVGSTKISLLNGCDYVWRYLHDGDVVTLDIEGDQVTSTPNHPFLTQRGWLPANEIEPGDYLVCALDERVRGVKDNIKKALPRFNDVFLSLTKRKSPSTRSGSLFNFHGDIPDNEVNEIRADIDLLIKSDVGITKNLCKFRLANSYGGVLLAGARAFFEVVKSGLAGAANYALSFVGRRFSHSYEGRLRAVSVLYPAVPENSCYDVPANGIQNGNFLNAGTSRKLADDFGFWKRVYFSWVRVLWEKRNYDTSCPESLAEVVCAAPKNSGDILDSGSGLYKFSRVTAKVVSEFSGHVYTLQSNNGWFHVGDSAIITKNCKCTMRPLLIFGENDAD